MEIEQRIEDPLRREQQKLRDIRSFDAQNRNGLKFRSDSEFNRALTKPLNGFTPIAENRVMKYEAPSHKMAFRYCQSFLGELCLDLQAKMYHFVLPDQFAEGWLYKVKDIEEDIDDEDLLNDENRKEASKRWEDLKEQIRWDPSLERTLEMLEETANSSMVRPECLTVEEAERAAQELNKQGRLRGMLLSYENINKIIEMWKKSITLVQ